MKSFEASPCRAPLVISFRFGHVSPYLCRHHAAGAAAAAAAAPAAAALVVVDMLSTSLVNGVAKGTETQRTLAFSFTDSKHQFTIRTIKRLKPLVPTTRPWLLLQQLLLLALHSQYLLDSKLIRTQLDWQMIDGIELGLKWKS